MILYLDASALVKRYVEEPGTTEVKEAVSRATTVGTALISRAEVAAAFAKAVRTSAMTTEEASQALQLFRSQWASYVRVKLSELVVARADSLAWQHGLRGYDAVHLAAALTWRDTLDARVVMATFDRMLWKTAGQSGLDVFPSDLPVLLEEWQRGRNAA
jgi:predicted nucleic acid-binding protein